MLIRYKDNVINLDRVPMFFRFGKTEIRFHFEHDDKEDFEFDSEENRECAFHLILEAKLQDLKMIDLTEKGY